LKRLSSASPKNLALTVLLPAILNAVYTIMSTVPDNHDAQDYAERIRERLPRRLQELREAAGFTKYGLSRESGVSREYLGKIERGKANPTLPVTAQISHGLGMTLEQFTGELEDDAE
jgi:DNA-binding XRE family transcriptional regulator